MKLAVDVSIDLFGILGTFLLAVPVLRDLSYREMLSLLRSRGQFSSAFRRAGEVAADLTETEMLNFRPIDRWYVICGLAAIAASYLLHLAGAIFVRPG